MSRTKKFALNSVVGISFNLINSFLSFFLQALFIRLLGLEYSGINSLFTNILSVLNIVDLGVNNAILFRMYKEIANNDKKGINTLLSLYKRICIYLSTIIAIAGICCIPFLDYLIKSKPVFNENLVILYLIILFTSVVTHLFDYRNISLIAYQERYILTSINYSFIFLSHFLQIIVLLFLHNIYIYLSIKLVIAIFNGFFTGVVSKKRYDVSWNESDNLNKNEMKILFKDIKSLGIYKICRTLDSTIDTFVISKFVSISTTAIYGSLNMLLMTLNDLLGQFNDAMIAGIGDIYAKNDKKHLSKIFYQSYHFTFMLYAIVTSSLVPFLTEFSMLWIGYTLPDIAIFVMLINFYMYGMGMNIATFRNSMGIFVKGWKRPAFTAILNLIFSLKFTMEYGLIGTLIGTLLSRTLTLVWYDPYIIIKYGLEEKPTKYYIRYILYGIITIFISLVMLSVKSILVPANNIILLIMYGFIYFFISSVLILIICNSFKEQKDLLIKIKNIILSILRRKGKIS